MNGMAHLEVFILAVLNKWKILGTICFSEQIFTENSHLVPLQYQTLQTTKLNFEKLLC